MKRISLVLLLATAVLIGSAQSEVPNFRKSVKKDKTEQESKEKTDKAATDIEVTSVTPSSATSDGEYAILRKAIDNAFLVVKASYNVRDRESGSNVSGTDFFSAVYGVAPLLPYGFGVDNRFLKPWKVDPKYDANKYGDDLVSIDKLEYKKANDTHYMPFALNKITDEKLAPDFFHVTDTTFQNLGLRVELGDGSKNGYMVWFHVNPENGETRYNVVPTNVTFNENTIFSVRQPVNPETVIGGAFLNLNADEPGCLHLTLMGVARIDPYGSGKWELVKMQSKPTPPVKAKPAESSKPAKSEAQPESEKTDESIIPDNNQSKAKESDKGKKSSKESNRSGSKESSKSTNKSDKNSGSSSNAKSSASSSKK